MNLKQKNMAKTQTAQEKKLEKSMQMVKNSILYRTHSLEILKGGKRKTIVVDLDVPPEKILKKVNFDSSLLGPGIVREILANALDESRAGKIPRKWSFEFVGITMNDKYCEELKLIEEISEDIQKGHSVINEVQSLESFLTPKNLSTSLSGVLSNKKLQLLSPLEIIFFAYARKVSGVEAFMPDFPVERILRYKKPNSPGYDVLKDMVPRITFPSFFEKMMRDKVTVEGHLLSGAELSVRMESNSYFIYKIDSYPDNLRLN